MKKLLFMVGILGMLAGRGFTLPQPTIETNSNAIKTAVETIDNAIAGNEMQVDVITLPALPAGSAMIGTVTIQDGGNSITIDGSVDVTPASPVATDYLPARITNGTAFVDPTQIRALTTSDAITASQGGAPWTVNATVTSLPALPAGNNIIGSVTVIQPIAVYGVSGGVVFNSYAVETNLTSGGSVLNFGTKTVTTVSQLEVVKITADGAVRALLKIAGTTKAELVTSPSHRTDSIVFKTPLQINAGQSVWVDVYEESGATQRISVTLVGHEGAF